MLNILRKAKKLATAAISSPEIFLKLLGVMPAGIHAARYLLRYCDHGALPIETKTNPYNPLMDYFENHTEGHGIWKWLHYFEIYQRHFHKYVDRETNILEIGIYSGGSLDLWHSYFGSKCHVYGVDIEDACKSYQNDSTTVFIGDQSDRQFWANFRKNTPPIDILIDDGGHTPHQQRVTLEEMLPHLRCGGVYLCEDVHGCYNDFTAFVTSFVQELNHLGNLNELQKSIHFYPFCVVIEKHAVKPDKLVAPKHGTIWQPFFDKK